jgi:hypothetical protein
VSITAAEHFEINLAEGNWTSVNVDRQNTLGEGMSNCVDGS